MMAYCIKKNIVILIVCTLFSVGSSWAVDGDEALVYRFGVSSKSFGKVNFNDVNAALKAWATTIEREQHIKAKIETILLTKTVQEIKELYQRSEFDGLAFSVAELEATGIQPEYVYVGNRGDGFDLHYILIVHSEGDVKAPKELTDSKIVTCDNNQMILSLQWLETLVAEHTGGQKISYPIMVENFSKAILQVFFRQADAAVVTREAFDLACELNPQLRQTIRVVCESPPLIPVVFLLDPSSGRKQDLETLERMILNIDQTPGGRQVLTVIQSNKMEKRPFSVLDTTVQFLREHDRRVTEFQFMEAQP